MSLPLRAATTVLLLASAGLGACAGGRGAPTPPPTGAAPNAAAGAILTATAATPIAEPPAPPTPVATATPAATPTPEGPNFIVLRASDVTPSSQLRVVGQGFLPSEKLDATFLSTKGVVEAHAAPLDALPDGRLNDAPIDLPAGLAPGEHKLRLVGQTSGRVTSATFRVYGVPPKVDLVQYSVKSDSNVTFSATGFAPGEAVEVRLGGLGGDPLAVFNADAKGELIEATTRIPRVQPGDYPLYFVGRRSQTPASVGLNVRGFSPWVVLDNYSPAPYYSMGFKGEDFAPGEEVLVYLGDTRHEPDARVTADTNGRFEVKEALPLPELHGENDLIFVGRVTGTQMTATFKALDFQPSLQLTVYAARPGATISFVGEQWAHGDHLHAFIGDLDGKVKLKEVATFDADQSGAFHDAGAFRIPPSTKAGGLPLTVVGDLSRAETTIWFEVMQLKASAELSAYKGPSGTTVSFGGNSFAPGEPVVVHARSKDGQVLAQATADGQGTLPRFGSYTVEGSQEDEAMPFVFVGQESGAEATTHFKVADPVAA